MFNNIDNLKEDFAEELHKRIGNKVKKIRKEKGLSQLDLSLKLGYKSVSPISGAEIYYNKIHFNIENLAKIAYVLDIDICEFFKE